SINQLPETSPHSKPAPANQSHTCGITSRHALGDPVVVGTDPTVCYRLWLPIPADETVVVRQSGCNADSEAAEEVRSLVLPLPVPAIPGPVRPAAAVVYASGFLRGAIAHLLVNGKPRTSQEAVYSDAWIPVPPPALVENDTLKVIQTLCSEASTIDQRGTPVTRGHLKISLSHPTIERGSSVVETVIATDADTGAPVIGAQVMLDGKIVGTTGTPFPVTSTAGQPNPNGLVTASGQYFDQPFTITLTDPPPRTAKLHLNLSPVIVIYQTLVLKSANWTVTPQWDPSKKVTATGANVTVDVVRPPGASGKVQIELAATWEVAGNINQYTFPDTVLPGHQSPNPGVVEWDGTERTIGWLTGWHIVEDGYGNGLLVVTENYQGYQ
ncbi:hypothetical protein ACIA5H_34835, partial [Nocardia sp. NPDC051900]|uniref:hypothetical protein n=1 Tax=Nocardia sp. NPDC051900 TaxID=3364326 RepID=UPI0037AA4C3A